MMTDSQTKLLSTGGPPELKEPQELTDYTSDLPGYNGTALISKKPAPPAPQRRVIEGLPDDLDLEDPQVQAALSQISAGGMSMPKVRVVEDGKETVGELDVGLITMVTQLAQLGQLSKIRKSLQRREFKGKLESMTLEATESYAAVDLIKDDPYDAWISATFANDGPNDVQLAINKQRPYHTLEKGETQPVDFSGGEKRICFIEYLCAVGETATVRALGKY